MLLSIVKITSLLLLFGTIFESQAQRETPKRCNIAYDCTDEDNPVWATTTGQYCEVFLNECLMLSENCDRVNTNRPEARKLSKRKCQELCRGLVCPTVSYPICGIYKGKKTVFENRCEMSRHICKTGETYMALKRGPCSET